jgi:ornithine cyclodeaminase/alanine dehydrogenase-like protein (mu-crystallin family)
MSEKLNIEVEAAASAEEAVRGQRIVVAATSSRSSEPVLRHEWLEGCRLLCAVGSTRPESVEVDPRCFGAASAVVVDSLHAPREAGDLQSAVRNGALREDSQITLARVAAGDAPLPTNGLVAFKSVGTALQDLALAVRFYELLEHRKDLPAAPDLASLKQPLSVAASQAKN